MERPSELPGPCPACGRGRWWCRTKTGWLAVCAGYPRKCGRDARTAHRKPAASPYVLCDCGRRCRGVPCSTCRQRVQVRQQDHLSAGNEPSCLPAGLREQLLDDLAQQAAQRLPLDDRHYRRRA